MRIYVIDDEPRQRRGMETLLKTLCADADILAFPNGEAALQSVADRPPNIVFSDIRMPRITGLEFAERILALAPGALVILISAYAEFEYAQRAISLGVFDYLTKPVQPAKVKDVLQKALLRLRADTPRPDGADDSQFRLWEDLFCGDAAAVSPEAACALLAGREGGRLVRIVIPPNAGYTDGDLAETQANLCYWFERAFPACIVQPRTRREPCRALHAVLFSRVLNAREARAFCDGVRKDYALDVSLLASGYRDSLSRNFGDARRELDILQKFLFYHEEGVCLLYDAFPEIRRTVPFCEQETFLSLISLIFQGLSAPAAVLGERIIREFASANVTPECFKDAVVHLLLKIFESLYDKCFPRDTPMMESAVSDIRAAGSFWQLCQTFTGVVAALCQRIHEMQDQLAPIRRAMLYVEAHYADKLTLAEVASQCHYSVSHFCSLFKAQTGKSFISYLNSVRMRQAVFLLSSSAMSVNDIACRVGFSDINYFNRLFKRKFQMTAQAYRDSLKKEKDAHDDAAARC